MNRIGILDCTLRDGGYINDFNFGKEVIKDIILRLAKASIDIIECGFLKSGAHDENRSLYGSVEELRPLIGGKNKKLMYVAMIQYGAITSDEICECDGTSIDGIRLTFHEHEIDASFEMARILMDKGYAVFMQPVGATTYSDEAFLSLIRRVNVLKPFAFYIVDTLGKMYKNDLLRMFYIVDHNLDKRVAIGFHSHNNLQMSFANAQEIIQLNSPRRIIIDSSVYGLGRGAGNLNTELITQFINTNFELTYENAEILEIIDEYMIPLKIKYKWGYDAAYYIASIVNCHPNYASFLLNKQTLRMQDIYTLLYNLSDEKKPLFDADYIAREYVGFLSRHVEDSGVVKYVKDKIGEKKVIVLAPGKSLREKIKRINSMIHSEDLFVVSVNFIPKDIRCDLVFVSNMKRFKGVNDLISMQNDDLEIIVTSNIMTDSDSKIKIIDFQSYNNEDKSIVDNAGLMCINFLNKVGVKSIILAGFDGFEKNPESNFFDQSLLLDVEKERVHEINVAISKRLKQLKTQMEISFAYETKYE